MVKHMRSERGGSEWMFAILLAVIACLVAVAVFSFISANDLSMTLREVEEGTPIALFMVDDVPESMKDKYPHAKMAKYISLTGDGKTIPSEGGYGLVTAGENERGCGELATVAPIFQGWQPKVGSMEGGKKVYVQTIGLTGVGSGGCEVGTFIKDADYNPDFTPFITGTGDPIQVASCYLRTWSGIEYTQTDCTDFGYMPTSNWIRQGAVPLDGGTGIYIVYAYATGVWVHEISAVAILDIFSTYDVPAQTQKPIVDFMFGR